jgi:hypothetical protein
MAPARVDDGSGAEVHVDHRCTHADIDAGVRR